MPSGSRRRFPGISSRAYEHPADRSALVALRKLSGFDTVFKALSGLLPERSLRLLFLSDSVRVSEQQFAHLNAMLRDACYILDLEKVPPMYVNQDPQPNAMCIGLDEPIIVVTTGLVELLDEEEMRAVVGHEVGHALSGHAVYRTILLFLTSLALKVAWIPLGNVAIMAIVTGAAGVVPQVGAVRGPGRAAGRPGPAGLDARPDEDRGRQPPARDERGRVPRAGRGVRGGR